MQRQAEQGKVRLPMLFVVGAPRSGTSWLSKIYDSHPGVLFRHEPDSVVRTNAFPHYCDPGSYVQHAAEAESYLNRLSAVRNSKVVGSVPVFRKNFQSGWARVVHSFAVTTVKAGERIPVLGGSFQAFQVPDLISDTPPQATIMKSIAALGRIGLYMDVTPGAKAVLIVRHPCGHIASTLRGIAMKKFDTSIPITEDMGVYEDLSTTAEAKSHGLDFESFKNMGALDRLAWRWALINEKAMNDLEETGAAFTLRYEDLCETPMVIAKQLFDFAGLDWNEQSEHFIAESTAHDGRESYYQIFRNPKQSAYKWRQEMAPEDIARILKVVAPTRPGALFPEDPVAAAVSA